MIEKARIEDAPQILELVSYYAEQELLLPRSLYNIFNFLRDFHVCREGERVVGCAALHISWHGLAEVRSLAVSPDACRRGIGTRLVENCLEEARQLGVKRVFVLTYVVDFFTRFGFAECDKHELPHKVWDDCINCPKFPDCQEVAMILDL